MKLSEAIRLGAMLKPQAFGAMSLNGGTCAYGAALDAIGGIEADPVPGWFATGVFHATCPACRDAERDRDKYRFNALAHLNDTHRWTREAIADWVATIEAQQESAVEQPAEATHA